MMRGLPSVSLSGHLKSSAMIGSDFTMRVLIPPHLSNDIAERLALDKTFHVIPYKLLAAGQNAIGDRRDVRRDDHILELPKRVALRQRLGIGHIEAGSREPPLVKRFDQRCSAVDLSPRDRDEVGIPLHGLELTRAHHAFALGGVRDRRENNIR